MGLFVEVVVGDHVCMLAKYVMNQWVDDEPLESTSFNMAATTYQTLKWLELVFYKH